MANRHTNLSPIKSKKENLNNYPQKDPKRNLIENFKDRQQLYRLGLTNHVLVHKQADYKNQRDIFLPGYLRMKVKNFTQINLSNLDAQINATILFHIHYGMLLQYLKDETFSQDLALESQKSRLTQLKPSYKYTKNQITVLKALTNQILLNFTRDDPIVLAQKCDDKKNLQTKIKIDTKKRNIKYSVRKLLRLFLRGKLAYTPLQEIHSIIQITVRPISIKIMRQNKKQQTWNIKFNLMDTQNTKLKLFCGDCPSFGNYSIIKNYLRVFYSSQRIISQKQFYMDVKKRRKFIDQQMNLTKQSNANKENPSKDPKKKFSSIYENSKLFLKSQQQQKKQLISRQKNQNKVQQKNQQKEKPKLEYPEAKLFQHAHFNIPLYKSPLTTIFTLFIPIWLIAVINLGIFFQDYSLGSRIGTISALMIAFVAFIPTIREQLPPNPRITLIQILIYAQTSTCFLGLWHSLRVRVLDGKEQNLKWDQTAQFIISLTINLICVFIVFIMMIFHYTCRKPRFEKQPGNNQGQNNKSQTNQEKKQVQDSNFNRKYWWNKPYDQHFFKLFKPILEKRYTQIDLKKDQVDMLFQLVPIPKEQAQKQNKQA